MVLTRGIREFMNRDWASVRQNKDAYWGARIARLGPLEGFRMAAELREQALQHDPSWPTDHDRQQDLLSHVRLTDLFRRAGTTRRT